MNIRVYNVLRKVASMHKEAGWLDDVKHTVQGFQPQLLIPSSKPTVPQPTAPSRPAWMQELLRASQDPRVQARFNRLNTNKPEWLKSALTHLRTQPAPTAAKVPGTGTEDMSYFERGTRSLKNLWNNITGNNYIEGTAQGPVNR